MDVSSGRGRKNDSPCGACKIWWPPSDTASHETNVSHKRTDDRLPNGKPLPGGKRTTE